ncbi:MAG: hypothetical protein JWP87_5636, partial [Labilithrix sp.]|nr:hypothetical protein [Labilithrix sp.]
MLGSTVDGAGHVVGRVRRGKSREQTTRLQSGIAASRSGLVASLRLRLPLASNFLVSPARSLLPGKERLQRRWMASRFEPWFVFEASSNPRRDDRRRRREPVVGRDDRAALLGLIRADRPDLGRVATLRTSGRWRTQPRERDLHEAAHRCLRRQAARHRQRVEAVARELGRRDVVPELSFRRALGEEVSNELVEVLLRSDDVLA